MYADVNELKRYLEITGDDDDAEFNALLLAAQRVIDEKTGRTFEATSDSTKYFDVSREYIFGPDLMFKRYDLAQITSVTNGDGTTIASTKYKTLPDTAPYYGIRLLSRSGVTWTTDDEWMDAIAIVGRWAYSVTAPKDINYATKRLAAHFYRLRDSQMYSVEAIEAGVVMKPLGIPVDVRAVIESYRKTVL